MKKTGIIVGTSVAGFLVLLIIIIAVAVSSSPQHKMSKALASRNAGAVNTLYMQAQGNPNTQSKYDKAINNYLVLAAKEINNKEYSAEDIAQTGAGIVYTDLNNNWGDLLYSENGETIEPSISYYNQTAWDELQTIIKSKASYCRGVDLRDNQNQPKEAIEAFQNVSATDSNYAKVEDEINKSVDMYIEQTLAEVQTLIDEENTMDAFSRIGTIYTYLEENGLYSEAVEKKLEETRAKYADTYAQKAEACFKEKDVDGTIGNMEVAAMLAPDNADYKTKLDTYEMYLPFYMYESDNILSTSSDRRIQIDDDVKAVNQKVYNNCLTYRYYQGCKDGSVKYLLEGKYDEVTGVYFSPKENATMNRTGSCYFVVSGDGKEIYKSKTISAESKPIDFSFSVKGIQNLEITFVGTDSSVWGVDAYSYGDYACIAELTATKSFPKE